MRVLISLTFILASFLGKEQNLFYTTHSHSEHLNYSSDEEVAMISLAFRLLEAKWKPERSNGRESGWIEAV